MLNELLKRYPCLESAREDIVKAENTLLKAAISCLYAVTAEAVPTVSIL